MPNQGCNAFFYFGMHIAGWLEGQFIFLQLSS